MVAFTYCHRPPKAGYRADCHALQNNASLEQPASCPSPTAHFTLKLFETKNPTQRGELFNFLQRSIQSGYTHYDERVGATFSRITPRLRENYKGNCLVYGTAAKMHLFRLRLS